MMSCTKSSRLETAVTKAASATTWRTNHVYQYKKTSSTVGIGQNAAMGPSTVPILPIHAHEEEIVSTIQSNPVVVVIAETGSGKTTQIAKVHHRLVTRPHKRHPSLQMLHHAGLTSYGMIGVTQPRRVVRCTAYKAQHTHVVQRTGGGVRRPPGRAGNGRGAGEPRGLRSAL